VSIAASLARFVVGRRRPAEPRPDPVRDAITRWRDASDRIERLTAELARHAEGMQSDDEWTFAHS
jgi:hypothetical protein